MGRGRRALGWSAVVLGAVVAVLALVVCVLVGPDNRLESGPHSFRTTGAAVATAPEALRWTGVTVEVTAAAEGHQVFVGVAHDVDVADYLHDAAYTRVDRVDIPWSVTTTEISGVTEVAVAPGEMDVWLVSDAGVDQATVRFPLPEAAVDVVVMDADGEPGLSTEVTVAVVESGLFVEAVALLLAGVGVVAVGVLMLRHAPRHGHRGSSGRWQRRRPRGWPRRSATPTHRAPPERTAEH